MNTPLVGLIMGSVSDWETMRHAAELLEQFGIPYEIVLFQTPPRPQETRGEKQPQRQVR